MRARAVLPPWSGLLLALLVVLGSREADPLTLWFAVALTPLGAFVLAGVPAHPIGRLMTASGVIASAGALSSVWVRQWAWWPPIGLLLLALLLFPDGRLASRRWRAPAILLVAGTGVAGVALAVAAVQYPRTLVTEISGTLAAPARYLVVVAFAAIVVVLGTGVVVLVLQVARWRTAEPAIRGQLACLLPAGGMAVVGLVLDGVGLPGAAAGAALAVPIGMTFAVLRHHLYDLDQVINRTVVWLVMTVLVLAGFVAAVSVLGTVLPGNGVPSAVATGVVLLAFGPLHHRVQLAVERLLYGSRHDPYAVISGLGALRGRTTDPEALLPLLTGTIARSLCVPYVAVELDDGTRPAEHGTPVPAVCEEFPLISRGTQIGRLLVAPRSTGERFGERERRLLTDIAGQAAAMAEALRLIRELRDARERLVRTREEERRSLRRDLHDGLGPALAGMAMQLHAARVDVAAESRTGTILEAMAGDLALCTTELRQLVSRLRPPALDTGLEPALRAECRRFAGTLPVTLDVDGDLSGLPAAVEVAAFRIVAEAVTNVARHAGASTCVVTVRRADTLAVRIADDGHGITPDARRGVGLGSMRERAEELGGTFLVAGRDPSGTEIRVELPVAPSAGATS